MIQRVELPNIAAEYSYVAALSCRACGGPTESKREGSSPDAAKGRMIDHWTLTCRRCGEVAHLELSVPMLDLAALLGEKE